MSKAVKYGILLVSSLSALYIIAPIGDSCSGLAHVTGWMLLAMIYVVAFLGFTGIDIYRSVRHRVRFDLVPLFITCLFVVATYWVFKIEAEWPWKEEVLRGRIEVGDLRAAGLVLYTDGTFKAHTAYVDHGCTYWGGYSWRSDTLLLLRTDLAELTNGTFTTNYCHRPQDNMLMPVGENVAPIEIKNQTLPRR